MGFPFADKRARSTPPWARRRTCMGTFTYAPRWIRNADNGAEDARRPAYPGLCRGDRPGLELGQCSLPPSPDGRRAYEDGNNIGRPHRVGVSMSD
jgi:hypothetical protein